MPCRSLRSLFSAGLLLLGTAGATPGCASQHISTSTDLPPPRASTNIGPGDMVEIFVVGETTLPKEYRVQPDGSIDFPYLQRLYVAGLEPQDIVSLLKQRLIDAKVLRDPQISLMVRQYNSKKISVIGQVSKPGVIGWQDGLKLIDAVSQAGWFTPIADSAHVILTRAVSPTKTVTVEISVDAITDGKQPDVPLQAGDTVKVEARTF